MTKNEEFFLTTKERRENYNIWVTPCEASDTKFSARMSKTKFKGKIRRKMLWLKNAPDGSDKRLSEF